MNAFNKWNLLLLQEYFTPGQEGEDVFIDTSPDRLDELGPALGGSQGLIKAVTQGPSWACGSSFHDRIASLIEQRSKESKRPLGYFFPGRRDRRYLSQSGAGHAPTYLPYLALLVSAWARGETEGGFYRTLRKDLGLPENWGPHQMHLVSAAWKDLEAWTNENGGRFGVFKARQIGQHPYVSLLRAQTILRQSDYNLLGNLFQECGLAPRSKPTQSQLQFLLASAKEKHSFSVGFRHAAQDPAFHGFVSELLSSAALEWDGSKEETGEPQSDLLQLRLGLSLSESDDLPWELMLAISGTGDNADETRRNLLIGNSEIPFQLEHGRGQVCKDPLLAETLVDDRRWDGIIRDSLRSQDLADPRRLLWVLVGERGPTGRFEAWEAPLPNYGNAYLLASKAGAFGLESYLEREKPEHEDVPTDGLPSGWRLIYLKPDQFLSESQRTLPDGRPIHRRLHAIRFERGVSIRRGGKRRFLSYDLPSVALDAPVGARLYCSGMTLQGKRLDDVELRTASESPEPAEDGGIGHIGVRHFELPKEMEDGGHLRLSARMEGNELASASLLIATSDQATLLKTGDCSLDSTGHMRVDAKGLRGSLDDTLLRQHGGDVQLFGDEFFDYSSLAHIYSSSGARFLDALAGAGTMVWSRARDLAGRLLALAQIPARPQDLIDDLWCRGHLEVERNSRGHYTLLHSVPPACHPLAVSVGGTRLHGLLGTLSLGQWKAFAALDSEGVGVFVDTSIPFLPAVRLHESVEDALSRAFAAGQLPACVSFQALGIANWSADTATILQQLVANRFEQPPENPRELRKLHVPSGRFMHANAIRPVRPSDPQFEVYQMLDPQIGRAHV